jgi:hypothetical protein
LCPCLAHLPNRTDRLLEKGSDISDSHPCAGLMGTSSARLGFRPAIELQRTLR